MPLLPILWAAGDIVFDLSIRLCIRALQKHSPTIFRRLLVVNRSQVRLLPTCSSYYCKCRVSGFDTGWDWLWWNAWNVAQSSVGWRFKLTNWHLYYMCCHSDIVNQSPDFRPVQCFMLVSVLQVYYTFIRYHRNGSNHFVALHLKSLGQKVFKFLHVLLLWFSVRLLSNSVCSSLNCRKFKGNFVWPQVYNFTYSMWMFW